MAHSRQPTLPNPTLYCLCSKKWPVTITTTTTVAAADVVVVVVILIIIIIIRHTLQANNSYQQASKFYVKMLSYI